MATTTDKIPCVKCKKPKNAVTCPGCSQAFCLSHVNEHHNELSEQLVTIEDQFNELRIEIDEQKSELQKHELIKINRWESDSIEKIRQVANEVRHELSSYGNILITDLNSKLKQLAEKLDQCRREDDFIDTDIQFFNEKLTQLRDTLNNPFNFEIEQDSTSFIEKLRLTIKIPSLHNENLNANVKWIQDGVTVAGGNGQGGGINQFNHPWSLCVDNYQTVYIADCYNHRIVEWKYGAMTGRVVAGGNGSGNLLDQLHYPADIIIDKERDSLIVCDYTNRRVVRWDRQDGKIGETIIDDIGCWGLTMDDDGFLYVVDKDRHEVRRYRMGEDQGVLVAGGNGPGNRLDQLYDPKYVFVDREHSVYVSDSSNHRVMKWMKDAKEGIVMTGSQGQGNNLTQLSNPLGIVVDRSGTLYVADCSNHRIMSWCQGATQGSVIVGGNGQGRQTNQLSGPIALLYCSYHSLEQVIK
ncbi:unnamed protein product [Rotaria sordida]|uniref:Uncharacterized protein n=2 Tax=Rotaria sordida TaxID=392033 RepID=A0A814L5I2_9BILA|nr:unnamed protein product [Rotaria sordida]